MSVAVDPVSGPWVLCRAAMGLGAQRANDGADSPPSNCTVRSDKLECSDSRIRENCLFSSFGIEKVGQWKCIPLSKFLLFCWVSDGEKLPDNR